MDTSPAMLMRSFAKAAPGDQRRIIWKMTATDALSHDAEFEGWAHEAQLPPPENGWRTWLMLAGRGFGKTRAGAEWIEKIARSRPGVRIALAGATIDEARRVMVEGVSGVLSVAKRRRHKVRWEPSLGRLRWPNGSEAQLFSGDNPDGLRGPEHDFAWCAAASRHRGRRSRRGASAERSARSTDHGRLLPGRRHPDGRLVAISVPRRRLR
jgi:phage terminase large subunit-like protein